MTRKRNCYVEHYLHNATKRIVEELVAVGVTKVVIGKNSDWKRGINLGRKNNQKFVQIPYNKFIDQLTYKLESVGIEVVVSEESYTSKASFLDWDNIPTYNPEVKEKPSFSGKRIKRAWYKAADGTLINADVNGAFNIGRKVVPTAFAHLKTATLLNGGNPRTASGLQIVLRDRGCLVVQPRRITPVFRRQLRSAPELLQSGTV